MVRGESSAEDDPDDAGGERFGCRAERRARGSALTPFWVAFSRALIDIGVAMMTAWSFCARLIDEVASLLRALGKHRYVKEVDHRIHWTVDVALSDLPAFASHAAKFAERRAKEKDLDVASRDPSLWRPADVEEIIHVLTAFWGPGELVEARQERLRTVFEEVGLTIDEHEAFQTNPEEPPFPELILLDWVLLPVDELDAERHRGALEALERAGEEVNASAPVHQEGPAITAVELLEAAPRGILEDELFIWSEGPYAYAEYVFRGAAKAAKLIEPPVGLRDLDEDE